MKVIGTGDYSAQLSSGRTDPVLPAVTPAEYFAFVSSTKTITQYYPKGPDGDLTEITMEGSETTIGDFLLHGYIAGTGNEFKNVYESGGAGTYTGTQTGAWTKVE